ncbi:hypothetical protein KSF_039090 [Reticulibacter mediterranei]|uniref:Uncharacterized protein n=1 Tax=Reticulibacter mediterranei TaxID=2778369 RepID=A0A8J3IR36_9CHLR|nr:hypothetical protein [Reticulibacter mediterranei]GHO93861.1 hypothetical protein KSF_039090 [Reticulibacter mediterranei]
MATPGGGRKSFEGMSGGEGARGDNGKNREGEMELQRLLLGGRQEGQSSEQSPEFIAKQHRLKEFYATSERAGITWPKPKDGSVPWENPNHRIHEKRMGDLRAAMGKEGGLEELKEQNQQGQVSRSEVLPDM